MKPILYSPTETAFDTNGIGILNDTISCSVKQALNGQYELSMKYPASGLHADSLTDDHILMVKPDPISDPQPFPIYRVVPSSNGTIPVYARHIAYRLMGIPVSPFSAASAADALAGMKRNAAVACPFTFSTDKSTAGSMGVHAPTAIWTLLGNSEGSVLDVYGGEYEFDRFNVHLHNHRGANRGVSIRYGKNLRTLEQDRNCSNVYTGVYPYWLSQDDQFFVELPEKIVKTSGTYSRDHIYPLDLSAEFEEAPTAEQLRARAEKYIADNDIGVPKVSWKIEFIQLEQTEEYKHLGQLEQVVLGDTVTVIFPKMNVNATARVVEVDYDPILERYNSITLGSVRANLATTIAQQQKEIRRKPSLSVMERVTASLTAAILGAKGGSVRHLDTDGDGQPDTFYIADNPDPDKALKVWRWNYEGWAASKNGYNGPFLFGATLEDGILAHAITAANLIAGTIQSADDGKTFFLDLDNGILRMNATELSIGGTPIGTDGTTQGIYLKDGKFYINLEYANTGALNADKIDLRGCLHVFFQTPSGGVYEGGYLGYLSGNIDGIPTDGVGLMSPNKQNYVIATDAGVRIQSGDYDIHLLPNGHAVINGDLRVNGNITYTGALNQQQ